MAATEVEPPATLSPRQKLDGPGDVAGTIQPRPIKSSLALPADPDAQATVTDFLDFTEHLPADITRSLTLIGKLDKQYIKASELVHELTAKWGEQPTAAPDLRTDPVKLRADISKNLRVAKSAPIYALAEAKRMDDNIKRHYNRIKKIHVKLAIMLQNYPQIPTQKSPIVSTKPPPQMTRIHRVATRVDGPKARRIRIPRITVPGDVLAPFDLHYDFGSSEEDSSDEDLAENRPLATRDGAVGQLGRSAPAQPAQRIRLIKGAPKEPKTPRAPNSRQHRTHVPKDPSLSTALQLRMLKPAPPGTVKGSAEAPWGQLTPFEMATLRKRMKKNAAWAPSDTMIARELKALGRSIEDYNTAKTKAEEEGRSFSDRMPVPVIDPETGSASMPTGALSAEAATSLIEAAPNRGMKLNDNKKLKNLLAKQAAEEAEQSLNRIAKAARAFKGDSGMQEAPSLVSAPRPKPPQKRKRDSVFAAERVDADKAETADASRPPLKRPKNETPIPPPQLGSVTSQPVQETVFQLSQRPWSVFGIVPLSNTPVPLPVQVQSQVQATARSAASPVYITTTTLVPIKPPADSANPPTTQLTYPLPPALEIRKPQAWRRQEQNDSQSAIHEQTVSQVASAADTFVLASGRDVKASQEAFSSASSGAGPSNAQRPSSRGQAMVLETSSTLVADRTRRPSTARNTPAPEKAESAAPRPGKIRLKRPAPGVISRTNSGGNSAIGERKAATKKQSTPLNHEKVAGASADTGEHVETFEVDDEGNVIDSTEPRYCICNRVSFGTMIQCDNVEDCKQEWFHLDCIGLTKIPARTTKWYCLECRKALGLGEKGEVSARGVKS